MLDNVEDVECWLRYKEQLKPGIPGLTHNAVNFLLEFRSFTLFVVLYFLCVVGSLKVNVRGESTTLQRGKDFYLTLSEKRSA